MIFKSGQYGNIHIMEKDEFFSYLEQPEDWKLELEIFTFHFMFNDKLTY